MTNLPANVDTVERPRRRAPRRPLRAQVADLRARYDALPKRQQWLVLGAMVLVGWLAADELLWSRARSWSAESSQIEAALDRGLAIGNQPCNNEAGRRPQIRCHHMRTAQGGATLYHGSLAINRDVRTQSL